jgi:hypothetical protein
VLVCHCAGLTPESAQVAERSSPPPSPGCTGRSSTASRDRLPVQDWAQPLTRDDDVSPPLYDLPVEWRIRTTPA